MSQGILKAQEEESLPSVPSLPIEIYGEIAGFVAGANNFGTLASFCAVSKTIANELKGILYETIIWNDAMVRGRSWDTCPAEFQYVKYIIGSDPLDYLELDSASTAFPQLRVQVMQELSPSHAFPYDEDPVRFTVRLVVYRTASLSIISRILKSYPLVWNFTDTYSSQRSNTVQGIHSVIVLNQATLHRGHTECGDLFTCMWPDIGPRQVLIQDCNGHDDEETQRLTTTIRTLAKIVPCDRVPRVATSFDHRLRIPCRKPETIRIWLQELPSWFSRNSDLEPHFDLLCDRNVERQDFLDLVQSFVDLYKQCWMDYFHWNQRARLHDAAYDNEELEERVLFQLISRRRNDDADEQYVAEFIEYPDQLGFRILVEEYPPFPPREEGAQVSPVRTQTVLLDQLFQPPLERLGSPLSVEFYEHDTMYSDYGGGAASSEDGDAN